MANPTLQANFSANTAGFTQGVSVLRQKLTELNTQMEQNKQEIKTANTEIKNYRKELEQLKKDTNNGATATAEQSRRMQELRDGIATATARLGTLRTTEQDLRRSINSTNEELRNQRTAVEEVKDSAATMGDVLKASLYSSAIQTAVSKLTQALKSAAEYCYNVGSSFEAAMSQVEAISGATGDDLDRLTAKAKELGATTRFSATEAASAMNYMAMAGWDAQQMLDGIGGVMSLAAAAGGDLAGVSDIVTDAITAFGLAAEDVGHFSDVLAAASSNANTNVAMMGETFKYCAPIAGALGFSIEDVSEAIGLMANSGIKSTMAGTALRTTFTKLSEGVTITGEKLGEVEIQTSNADGSMRSLKEILDDLRGAFSQLTEAEKASTAEDIAGKNAMSGFLALMNAGAGDVDKLRTAIENCGNASAEMADTMTNNTAGAVTIMKSAMESAGIAAYEKFGDKIRSSVEGITDIFTDLTERIQNGDLDEVFERVAESVGNAAEQIISCGETALPDFIEGIANVISFLVEYRNVIAGVVGAMITFKSAMAIGNTFVMLRSSISRVITAVNSATTATQALTTAQAANNAVAAANPYVAVASVVLALVGGLVTLIATTDSATESVEKLRDKTDELNKTAQNSRKAADDIEDLADEYKQLKSSADDTKEAKQRLTEIQDTLIGTYGTEAENLDLVNGKYEEQLGLLSQLSTKKREESMLGANAAYYSALEMSEQGYRFTISPQKYGFDNVPAEQLLEASGLTSDQLYITAGGEFIFQPGATSYDERLNAVSGIQNYFHKQLGEERFGKSGLYSAFNDIVSEINKDKDIYDKAVADYEYYQDYNLKQGTVGYGVYGNTKAFNDYYAGKTGAYSPAETGDTPPYDENDYNSSKNYYKYLLDIEQITAAEYWNTIEQLRDRFYEENTEEWRDITAEIYKGRKTAANSSAKTKTKTQQELNEEQYTSEKSFQKWRLDMGYITEEEYYDQIGKLRDKYLEEGSEKWRAATLEIHKYEQKEAQKSLDKLESMYNSAINAIDEEIKQRDREQEDEDIQKQIDEVDKQLQYDRLDDFSRQQLEQKKQELLDEKEDIEWRRSKEDLKDDLETVYTMSKEAYEESSANLNDILRTSTVLFGAISNGADQMSSVVNTVVNNNTMSFALSAVSQTADQIASAVIRAISSSI
ncbi:MAG: phage tail tape measure protein [Oscillospiraceae bacterium]